MRAPSAFLLLPLLRTDSEKEVSEVVSIVDMVCWFHIIMVKGQSKKRCGLSSSSPKHRVQSTEVFGYSCCTYVLSLCRRRSQPKNRTLSGTFCLHINLHALLIKGSPHDSP